MYDLPTTIDIKDKRYPITNNGDFRMVLDCYFALEDEELTRQERLLSCLVIFYDDINSIQDALLSDDLEARVEGMFDFLNCGDRNQELGAHTNTKLIDWEKDEVLIISAVNTVAKKEVRAEKYMHWWTFMAYYLGIGNCTLAYIVGIRDKIARGKKLEKEEREFKTENPQYFSWDPRTVDHKEADQLARDMWNSNK